MADGMISNEATLTAGGRPRRLWKAALAGHLVITTLIWAIILAWSAYDTARLEEGHYFEDDRTVRPPALFTAEWLWNAAVAYGRIAIVTMAYAIPLMVLFSNFERRFARPGALAGAAASLPLAGAWVTIAALSQHSIPLSTVLVPLLLLLLAGTLGGIAAGRVRKGPRR